jgi:membrane protein
MAAGIHVMRGLKTILALSKQALLAAWEDNVPRMGASVAYYTLFAIAPVLLVAIAIAGTIFEPEAVRGEIVGQLDGLLGRDGAAAVQALLEGAARRQGGTLATIVGMVTFVLAATGAFLELQAALDKIWRVEPDPGANVSAFLKARAQSFGLVVGIGFLLLVSLAVNAALAAASQWVGQYATALPILWNALDIGVSLIVVTLLFAMLFKFLPDVRLHWRHVLIGALVTAVLFNIGKQVIGLYLGQSATASSYGAAGSVIVLLIWVYYSAQIVLLGAEFTRAYTKHLGSRPTPESFAKRDPHAAAKT